MIIKSFNKDKCVNKGDNLHQKINLFCILLIASGSMQKLDVDHLLASSESKSGQNVDISFSTSVNNKACLVTY